MSKSNKQEYGKIIRRVRDGSGMSQASVAKYIGMSRTSYIAVEQGKRELTLSEVVQAGELFNIEIDEMLPTKHGKNIEKYKQMLFFIMRSIGKPVAKTKLAKLLYLADFAWFYNTYDSMSGMTYRKMTHGPVPNDYFSILGELEERKLLNKTNFNKAELYSESMAGKSVSDGLLNKEEKVLMKKIVKKWADKSTDEIVGFTHNQLPYLFADSWQDIPYELIIQEDPKNVY